jgi:hypothetical protein
MAWRRWLCGHAEARVGRRVLRLSRGDRESASTSTPRTARRLTGRSGQLGEAVGVCVGVRAGHLAGEDVMGVHRHEGDVALARVAVGQCFDVRGEPEAFAAGERDG